MKKVNIVARILNIGNGKGGLNDTTCDCRKQLLYNCAARIKLHRWD
jgi:hypothetical protein